MSKNIALSGDLQFISLADIFQILGGSNRSGTLKLTRPDGLSAGVIYFIDGNPINAMNGSLYGIEAINKMFGWMEGRFEFCDERVQVEPIINLGSMRIVLDALRLLDEGAIERLGNEYRPSDFYPNQLSISNNPVIKGPPIDYAYFLDEERFADGTKIVGEGDEGNWLWVILEGTVRITRETSNGPLTLGLLGEGSFIGTFTSFEYWKNARFATVTAVGNVCLGVFDSVALYARYCTLSSDFQKLLLSLTTRMKKINDRMMAPSTQYQPVSMLPDGTESMFETERLSNEVLSITNGEAYLFGREAKSDKLLFMLEKDDVLGKLPFYDIGQEPHCATVIASKDFETQKINTDNIMKEYTRLPRVLRNMINNVSTCVAKTTLDFLDRDGVELPAETVN
jgi:hypothetical protein